LPFVITERIFDACPSEAAAHAAEVMLHTERTTLVNGYDLVDAVAKNETTVHDADVSLVNGGEGAVEIAGERGEGVHLRASDGKPPHSIGRAISARTLSKSG